MSKFKSLLMSVAFLVSSMEATGIGQTITEIPTWGPPPSGEDQSIAYAVNSDGTVVVGSATAPIGTRPFRWTPTNGLEDIGMPSGVTTAAAFAVSADGNVIVGDAPTLSPHQPFRWTYTSDMMDLGIFGGFARGVSANGLIVGGTLQSSNLGFYRWTSLGGFQTIGLYPGAVNSVAYGMSADGSTLVGIGWDGVFGFNDHALKWSVANGWEDLGFLPGGSSAAGFATTPDGSVVVGMSTANSSPVQRAVRWTGTTIEDLGVPPNAGLMAAVCVSVDGSVIGGHIFPFAGLTRAFIWTETFGFENLDQFLTAQGVDITGWTNFQDLRGISADGTALVGWGRKNSLVRGFVVRGLPPVCGPRITAQPQNTVGCVGGTTMLSVDAFGPTLHTPSFQWQKRNNDGEWNDLPNMTSPWGSVFSGTSTPVLNIANASANDVPGMYRCMIAAGCASRASTSASVSLLNQTPTITGQPIDAFTCPGDSATFSIPTPAPANGPYTYQWERETFPNSGIFVTLSGGFTYSWDGNVPGYGGIANGTLTPTLTLVPDLANGRNLGPAHSRNYRCVVSNACGGTASVSAALKAVTSCITGDLNCDGVVSVGDIGSFVLALTNPQQYDLQYPNCTLDNADINDDGFVTVGDIGGFVAVLTGG